MSNQPRTQPRTQSQTPSTPETASGRGSRFLAGIRRAVRPAGAAALVVFLVLVAVGNNDADRTLADAAPTLFAGSVSMALLLAGHFLDRRNS